MSEQEFCTNCGHECHCGQEECGAFNDCACGDCCHEE